jgi:hypothetical protein
LIGIRFTSLYFKDTESNVRLSLSVLS